MTETTQRPSRLSLTLVELVCGHGMAIFIAAIFEWKPLTHKDTLALEQVVDVADRFPAVDIGFTLTEHRMPR